MTSQEDFDAAALLAREVLRKLSDDDLGVLQMMYEAPLGYGMNDTDDRIDRLLDRQRRLRIIEAKYNSLQEALAVLRL